MPLGFIQRAFSYFYSNFKLILIALCLTLKPSSGYRDLKIKEGAKKEPFFIANG